ncbi:MAG: hydrolase [Legionella sp.]
MIISSEFKPAWWLNNPHAQTIFPTLTRKRWTPVDYHERVELPDGDFIDLAWAVNGLPPDSPLVLLLHGLGGNLDSPYVGGLLYALNKQGWRAVLMHFRGASPDLNRLPRSYHSGETADLDYILNTLASREPATAKAIIGISLGGNVLLKWLGEQRQQRLVAAAVAVSVPLQLWHVADRMNKGFSQIYQAYLLRKLRKVFAIKIAQHQEKMPFTYQDLLSSRCFWTFDEHIIAPLHGFDNVHDYYSKASSRQYLPHIATPTLIIHALDDPFMNPDVLPIEAELPADVTLELSSSGGHVGFITGKIPAKPIYWLEQRIPHVLKQYLS